MESSTERTESNNCFVLLTTAMKMWNGVTRSFTTTKSTSVKIHYLIEFAWGRGRERNNKYTTLCHKMKLYVRTEKKKIKSHIWFNEMAFSYSDKVPSSAQSTCIFVSHKISMVVCQLTCRAKHKTFHSVKWQRILHFYVKSKTGDRDKEKKKRKDEMSQKWFYYFESEHQNMLSWFCPIFINFNCVIRQHNECSSKCIDMLNNCVICCHLFEQHLKLSHQPVTMQFNGSMSYVASMQVKQQKESTQ